MSTGTAPHYLSEMLPGWMIGGAGVGLALPTILAAATADLPPHRAATGSAVVNMSRQIGTALGVAGWSPSSARPLLPTSAPSTRPGGGSSRARRSSARWPPSA
ncbi:hypothetical protein [Streptomyces sp. NPDC002758]